MPNARRVSLKLLYFESNLNFSSSPSDNVKFSLKYNHSVKHLQRYTLTSVIAHRNESLRPQIDYRAFNKYSIDIVVLCSRL